MVYLLALFAMAIPALLVVQTVRGRVRLQCCAADAEHDARMRVSDQVPQAPAA